MWAIQVSVVLSLVCRVLLTPFHYRPRGPSRGRDVAVYVFNINQPSLSNPFYSVLVSFPVLMALLLVFHSVTEGRPWMSDVSPLSGISGLSFDSTLLSTSCSSA